MRDFKLTGKEYCKPRKRSINMSYLVKEPDAHKDLGALIDNIVKINNLICRASQRSNVYKPMHCVQGEQLLSPCYAHTIVDANVGEGVLSDSDIDLLMLIGEGLSHQQISCELGVDTTQIQRWRDEIVRKARISVT
ncbi:MAG: hypothetical protein DKT66_26840 [Candidatus Melainabacteria bacterium]|nr:MAG: hypothetical protein DKT66_26840 [Candidatus Melainabacteria bacterium]